MNHASGPADVSLPTTPADSSPDGVSSKYLRTALLARLAHDIRSPIGVASGALHELEGALGPAASEHKVWFTMLRRGLKRLLRLADRLSMVAELEEHDGLDLARARGDLGALVTEAVTAAKFVQSRSSVTVETVVPEGVFATFDARWLEPALVDVICNAIRFAHRRVRVTVTAGPERHVVAIEDDGQGISPAAMATLFVRFAPLPGSGGSGLSLPVAHAVVVGHGGRLSVEASELPPGNGATRGARIVIELEAS